MAVTLDRCRNLQVALGFISAAGHGTCFVRSAALALDLPGSTLVFGSVSGATPEEQERFGRPAATAPFIHAWVEYKGMLYAPTLFERIGGLLPLPIADYYRANTILRTWPLPPAAFSAVARRYRLAAAFKHGKDRAGRGEVISALLRAAGVQYRVDERGGILAL